MYDRKRRTHSKLCWLLTALFHLQYSSTLNWNGISLCPHLLISLVKVELVEMISYLLGIHIILYDPSYLRDITLKFSAQAGFNRMHGLNFYTLPGSGTSDILFLSNTSYVNMSGVWIFRIDEEEAISIGGT